MEHAAADAPAWLLWLQEGAVGAAMRQSPLLYPLVEILHILGFALLVGSIVALDLRLLGASRALPAEKAGRHLLAVALGGFALALPTGFLLFTTEAASIAFNPAFQIKLGLLLLAGLNAALFHLGPWRSIAAWGSAAPPRAARLGGAASLVLWIGVLAFGRLIAYF